MARTLGSHLKKNPLISPLILSVENVSSASLAILGIIVSARDGISAIFVGIFIFSKLRVKSEGFTNVKNRENPKPPINILINTRYKITQPPKAKDSPPTITMIGERAQRMLNEPLMFLKIITSLIIKIKRKARIQFLFKIINPNCIEIIRIPIIGWIFNLSGLYRNPS